MGIGDKKSVLRGMYQSPPGAAPSQTPSPSLPALPQLEARIDSLNALIIHAALYPLSVIGCAAIAATLFSLYSAGLTLEPSSHIEKYFRDGVYLVAEILFDMGGGFEGKACGIEAEEGGGDGGAPDDGEGVEGGVDD